MDTQHLLQRDLSILLARLASFIGPDQDESLMSPGCMVGAIFSHFEGDKDVEMSLMIECACSLANRAILIKTDHADESESATDRPRKMMRLNTEPDCCHKIDCLLQTLFYLQQALNTSSVSFRFVRDLLHVSDMGGSADNVSTDKLAAGVERFSKLEVDDTNRLQNLLLFLLNSAQSLQLRRNGTDVYRKIYTSDGYDTRAWERTQSIKEFVYQSARKELNFDQWLNLTSSSGNASAAAEHLTYCHDVQFPDLTRDRHVFAFSNGMYLADRDVFMSYHQVASSVPASVAACKYFQLPFDNSGCNNWYDIPTPSLQRILEHQEFSEEVSRWMYILIGRLIYNLNEYDGWQVIPYLMGQAGSGKSSILVKVCRSLYDIADVGVLSNNLERKFGLAAFADKYLFIAPEIKHDLQLEQAEFQSLVSGEALQLNIKYKTAVTVDWVTPGIMAGNEFPNFKNNSGSIDRRVVVFEFVNSVICGDMDLGKKLEAEMPTLIKKSNVAYRQMTATCGRDDVWSHLPVYFKERRKELAEVTNTLADFVSNGPKLTCCAPNNPPAYILIESFKDAYREFCLKNRYIAKKLNDSDIRSELRKYFPTVTIAKKTCHAWPVGCGVMRSGSYIESVGWTESHTCIDDLDARP